MLPRTMTATFHKDYEIQMEQNFSNPLSAAVAKRDSNVLETVRDALKYGRTALAFQPVIEAGAPKMSYFMKV